MNYEKKSNKYTELRKKAQIVLKKNINEFDEPSFTNIKQLIEELQLYHIELEMQNEELQKTQESLEESRNKFSDLYDFAPVGYFTLDNSGTILNVNLTGANLLGVERKSLLKKRFSDFINKDDQNTFYLHRQIVLESKDKQTCEIRIRKKDDTQFFGLLESIAVEDGEGNSNKYRTTITDITDRKRTEEELQKHRKHLEDLVKTRTKVLEQTNAELETYAYSVAHDLRAPIRAIRSFGELLIKDYGKQLDIEGKNYLKRIIDASQRMNIMT